MNRAGYHYLLVTHVSCYTVTSGLCSRQVVSRLSAALQHATVFRLIVIFFAARCSASVASAVMRCPLVRLFVTFVKSVKTNIISFFHHRVTTPFYSLSVRYQTLWQYSDGTPLTGASNAGHGMAKISNSQRISGIAIGNCCTVVSLSHLAAGFFVDCGYRTTKRDAL